MYLRGFVANYKFMTSFWTILTVFISGLFALWLSDMGIDFLSLLATIFTGLAAFATAYAALSASKSAKIAERSASMWKQQMLLDIELSEAKNLKVALHAWHRHFINESNSKNRNLASLLEHFEEVKKTTQSSFQIHFRKYIEKQSELFSDLEVAFDQAGFIEHDFEQRIRLRRLFLSHREECERLIEHISVSDINIPNDLLPITLTAIYKVSDWHELDLRANNIFRVKMEKVTDDGKYEPILKADGSYVYGNLNDQVQGWFTNIGIKVDVQVSDIKSRITSD
nr:hypothetical protein BCU45_19400 [Vibrio lentus]PMJ56415.1 hypothetical protein BCU20_20605 [Vibrio lentus]